MSADEQTGKSRARMHLGNLVLIIAIAAIAYAIYDTTVIRILARFLDSSWRYF